MSNAIPSATVQIKGKPVTVDFDFTRLVVIEKAVGKSANELAFSDFPQLNPPKHHPDGRELTLEEQHLERLRKLRIGDMVPFVAGCLGVADVDLVAQVPMSDLRAAFFALVQPFLDAVMQINGIDPDTVKAEGNAEDQKDAAAVNPPSASIPDSPT